MLPSITNVINLADSHDRAAFAMVTHVKQEPRERENSESKEEVTDGKYCGESNLSDGIQLFLVSHQTGECVKMMCAGCSCLLWFKHAWVSQNSHLFI